jgi:transposase
MTAVGQSRRRRAGAAVGSRPDSSKTGRHGAETWISKHGNWTLEVVRRRAEAIGFKVLPRRWAIERTFGWIVKQRRLARDYVLKIAAICTFLR